MAGVSRIFPDAVIFVRAYPAAGRSGNREGGSIRRRQFDGPPYAFIAGIRRSLPDYFDSG